MDISKQHMRPFALMCYHFEADQNQKMSNPGRNTCLENVQRDFTQIGNSEAGGSFLKLNQIIPASKSRGTVF